MMITAGLSQELLISSLALATPCLSPNNHRNTHQHRQYNQHAIASKGPSVVSRLDKILNGEGDGEVYQ